MTFLLLEGYFHRESVLVGELEEKEEYSVDPRDSAGTYHIVVCSCI